MDKYIISQHNQAKKIYNVLQSTKLCSQEIQDVTLYMDAGNIIAKCSKWQAEILILMALSCVMLLDNRA